MALRGQTNLFPILIIIIGMVGGYLYYTQFGSEPVVVESDIVQRSDLDAFENIDLNFSALDLDAFKVLRQIGESPVEPGEVGKRDIFGPVP